MNFTPLKLVEKIFFRERLISEDNSGFESEEDSRSHNKIQ